MNIQGHWQDSCRQALAAMASLRIIHKRDEDDDMFNLDHDSLNDD
jgi:hypothetical protein